MIRTCRGVDLIAKAILTPQGYAKPVLCTNPAEAFAQALAISEVRRGRRTSFTDLVFGLFISGNPVDIIVLRQAYRSLFEGMFADLRKASDCSGDDLDLAAEVAGRMLKHLPSTKHGRFMARRARQLARARRSGESSGIVSEEAILTDALMALVIVLIGGDLGSLDHFGYWDEREGDPIDHLLELTGLAGFHQDRVGSVGPIVESAEVHRRDIIEVWTRLFSLESLFEFSRRADYDQLARAHHQGQELVRLSVGIAEASAMTGGPQKCLWHGGGTLLTSGSPRSCNQGTHGGSPGGASWRGAV
jgi:hypothetical protein